MCAWHAPWQRACGQFHVLAARQTDINDMRDQREKTKMAAKLAMEVVIKARDKTALADIKIYRVKTHS